MSLTTAEIEKIVEKAVVLIEESVTLTKPKRTIVYDAVKSTMDEILGQVWNAGYNEGKKNAIAEYKAKLDDLKATIQNWGGSLG